MTRPARIQKVMTTWRRKPNERRAATHLAFVRDIGICIACGSERRCQAMHVRNGTDGGVGVKPSDKYTLPGCPICHARQHKVGEVTFWGELGIDPLDAACRLWTVSGDVEAGRRIIFRARQSIALKARAATNFAPVCTKADLLSLDPDEIFAGYTEYRPGDPEPGPNRGRAYWHGWRNAAIDHHELPMDDAAAQLAREIAPGGKFDPEVFGDVAGEMRKARLGRST